MKQGGCDDSFLQELVLNKHMNNSFNNSTQNLYMSLRVLSNVLQMLNDPKCLDLLQKDPKAQMFGSTLKKLNVKFNEYK